MSKKIILSMTSVREALFLRKSNSFFFNDGNCLVKSKLSYFYFTVDNGCSLNFTGTYIKKKKKISRESAHGVFSISNSIIAVLFFIGAGKRRAYARRLTSH